VSLELIDEPEIPMRQTFDDEKFDELVDSIRVNGVQVALIVEPRAERYVVIAGHRRLKACRVLNAITVPCDVRQPGESADEAVKMIENDDRESVNPAESAWYLWRLFTERCNRDVDQVVALTRKPLRYVDERLRLFQGDEDVFTALSERKISFGVAKELNAIRNVGYRRLYLDNAVKFGMTIAAAADARRNANAIEDRSQRPAEPTDAAAAAAVSEQPTTNVCHVCRKSDHPERMRYVVIHEHCDLAFLEPLLAPIRASMAPESPRG
jgi:ParB/RepB/Spo0J family partition protein